MVKEKKRIGIWGLISILLSVAVLLVLAYAFTRPKPEQEAVPSRPDTQLRSSESDRGLIRYEEHLDASVVEDGLRDMGLLVTEEYYFTEVLNYSSIKKYWNIPLSITESSYLASYDGVVQAGIDFGRIKVRRDEDRGVLWVTLPPAQVTAVDLNPESFTLYAQRNGLGNPITAEDFNQALLALEEQARVKAEERGLLQRADENARAIICRFAESLMEHEQLTVAFA